MHFLRELQDQIRKIYYRLIAEDDQHSLSFKEYQIGRELGIHLPEATRLLRSFSPAHADTDRNDFLNPIAVPVGALYLMGKGMQLRN